MNNDQSSQLADAIVAVLSSPNVCDSTGEAANLTDVVAHLANAIRAAARAITDDALAPITEAVRDITVARRINAGLTVPELDEDFPTADDIERLFGREAEGINAGVPPRP